MNFDSKLTDVLSSLNWATAEEEYEPSEIMNFVCTEHRLIQL